MPPKTRRARDGPVPSQSTISFKHKISKSSAAQHTGKDAAKKPSSSKSTLNPPAQEIIVEAIRCEQTPQVQKTEDVIKAAEESPVRIISKSSATTPPQKGKRRARRSLNDDEPNTTYEECEKRARGTSDSQIERYWQKEEDKRLAPRVHQKDLHVHERILRHFDMCAEHGPCIGITRLQRWRRAHGLGSNPPIEVLATLLKEEEAGSRRRTGRIAYVDELCGGRDVLVD